MDVKAVLQLNVFYLFGTLVALYPAFCIQEKNDLQLLGNLEWIQSSEAEC